MLPSLNINPPITDHSFVRRSKNFETISNRTPAIIDLLIWLMICSYLYIDTISGLLMTGSGGQAPLSQMWKAAIVFLLIISLSTTSLINSSIIIFIILLLSVGPIYRIIVYQYEENFIWEFATLIKVLLPLFVVIWCIEQSKRNNQFLLKWSKRALWSFVFIFLFNIAIGAFGFGFTSYGSRESGGLGNIGYFYAGNEVGALFAVLSSFILIKSWEKGAFSYSIAIVFLFAMSVSIATKSAILSLVIFSILFSFFAKKEKYFCYSWKFLSLIIFSLILLSVAIYKYEYAFSSDILRKISYIYSNQGVSGIIFSGRDGFAIKAFEKVWETNDIVKIIFGIGTAYFSRIGVKESIESDPIDVYLWYGIPGLLYFFFIILIFTLISIKFSKHKSDVVYGVALVNIVIFSLSFFSGHVLVGGLAGIAWATLNGLALAQGKALGGDCRRNVIAES